MKEFRVVITTAPNMQEAKYIAKELVNSKLAACVNIVQNVLSFYIWEDELKEDSEVMLIIKSINENIADIENRLRAIHPYEVFEFITLKVEGEGGDYLSWIEKVIKN